MRKILSLAACAVAALFMTAVPAGADSRCAVGAGSDPVAAGAHDGGAQVCANAVVVRGTVTATPGYIVVDGAATNPEPLDGYVGYSASDGGLVYCASGEYAPGGGNNTTIGLTGPCTPQPGI